MVKLHAAPRTSGGYNYPAEPRQQVVELVKLLKKPSDILDIGAGFGNNCIPLLEAGHIVTATETNKECIAFLKDLGKKYPGRLKVIKAPIQKLPNSTNYDVVVCTMVLHFLSESEAGQAIATMQRITRKGGYNVITNYLAGQDISPRYTWLVDSNKLPTYYKDGTIVSYEESYPFTLKRVRTARQLVRWILGRKGFKSARLIARS